jgi:hypothetical protein
MTRSSYSSITSRISATTSWTSGWSAEYAGITSRYGDMVAGS